MFKDLIYREEFYNYIQIVEGPLSPESYLSGKECIHVQDFITKSNTFDFVVSKSIDEVQHLLNDLDYKRMGFKQLTDAQVNITPLDNAGSSKIVITPKIFYSNKQIEKHIIQVENQVTRSFIYFISDEYERIKTRSLRSLNLLPGKKEISHYAHISINQVDYLLSKVQNKLNYLLHSDHSTLMATFNILSILKYFLLKSLKHYLSIFNSYVGTRHNSLLLKYTEHRFPKLLTKNQDNVLNEPETTISQPSQHKNTSSDNNTDNPQRGIFAGKIKWFFRLNVLTTLIEELNNYPIQTYNDSSNSGNEIQTPISLSKDQMIDLVHTLFVDKDGKEYSKETLRVYFNDSYPEKRAKSPNKIDIDKFLNK